MADRCSAVSSPGFCPLVGASSPGITIKLAGSSKALSSSKDLSTEEMLRLSSSCVVEVAAAGHDRLARLLPFFFLNWV